MQECFSCASRDFSQTKIITKRKFQRNIKDRVPHLKQSSSQIYSYCHGKIVQCPSSFTAHQSQQALCNVLYRSVESELESCCCISEWKPLTTGVNSYIIHGSVQTVWANQTALYPSSLLVPAVHEQSSALFSCWQCLAKRCPCVL